MSSNNDYSRRAGARRPLPERFWAKVDKAGPVHPVLGTRCWLWTGARARYGHIGEGGRGGRLLVSSRVAWELQRGSIPNGMNVLHRCDVPTCVRIDHLFLGTHADNAADRDGKGRGVVPKSGPGETNPAHKLTAQEVLSIRDLVARGHTRSDVAARFGVDPSNVSRIVTRASWSHLRS